MIDLHMHSTASDGTDRPEELSRKVREAGITTFALTDHDTITGAMGITAPEGVKFIRGVEFSCRTRNGKCHILGLNYDPENDEFVAALKTGEELRHKKTQKRIEVLRDSFGITFTPEEINYLSSLTSVGKPHIANLIVSKGFAVDKQDAITRYINKCRTGSDKITAEQAVTAINASGGVSVWAHPLGGEGEHELTEEAFREILTELLSYGLKGLECWYSKYDYAKCEWLEAQARTMGLYVSGGSDYHGKNKAIPLGKLNAENIPVPDVKITILGGIN